MKGWVNFTQRSSKSKIWQMRINFWARRRPARSSWGRRFNKMFWQLSRGQGRALSFQLQISNGDPSSILISGTLGALIITESRSYKPSGIPSNRWLVSPRLYITMCRAWECLCLSFSQNVNIKMYSNGKEFSISFFLHLQILTIFCQINICQCN